MLDEPTEEGATLALIDCGLMASIDEEDRDHMISAVIHLANKDYASLVDDFISLGILPPDTARATVIPLMDKALTPYVMGGGAKKYESEVRRMYGMDEGSSVQAQVGGFQAMTQDALTVLDKVPFSIPPYFAILGRAIVTLEGVALTGNDEYGIIMESYPFIARKLMKGGRPEIQKALQEVLYSNDDSSNGLKLTRLLALLNNAAGAVKTQEGAVFVDLDAIPDDGISVSDGLKFVLSDQADTLRSLLEGEMDNVIDVLSRQIFRRAVTEAVITLTPPRPPSIPFLGDIFPAPPKMDEVPLPILLPASDGSQRPSLAFLSINNFVDFAAPKLDQKEEIFAIGLAEAAGEFLGDEIGDILKGKKVLTVASVNVVLDALRNGVFGRNNLVSPETAEPVIQFVQNSLRAVRRDSSSSGRTTEFSDSLKSLTPTERARFDGIMNELTQRAIKRTVDRLAKVERLA